MSWLLWLRVVAVTAILIPFVQFSTRLWAERTQVGGRHLRILEACSLGSDGRLYLIEVAGKAYALIAGAKGFQVIGEVEVPEALAELRKGEGVRGEVRPLPGYLAGWLAAAATLLRRARGQQTPADGQLDQVKVAGETGGRAVDVLEEQLKRLRRLAATEDEAFAVGKR